jgi:hypothetical protein
MKVTAKPRVVSIMASMDEAARHRFSERANKVAERKEAERKERKAQQLLQAKKENQRQNQQALKIKQRNKGFAYWLLSASFAQIFKKIITGH